MKATISCLCLIFFFFSCKKDKLKKNDDTEIRYRYFQLENLGWKSKLNTQKIDNIDFTAVQVPIEYYLLKDQGSQDLVKVDSIYEKNKTNRIIEFTFSDEEQQELLQEKFTSISDKEAVEYMSFKIQNDFYVVTTSKDTVSCSGVLYERNFKTAPYNKLILYFTDINPDDKIQLVYHDKLFNKGILKFRFQEKILIP